MEGNKIEVSKLRTTTHIIEVMALSNIGNSEANISR